MPPAHTKKLVELARAMDESPWHGFLVAESKSLVVLHRVSDRFDLDGYCAFRREDLLSISDSFEKRDLVQRALLANGQHPKTPEGLDCTSMQSLMEFAQAEFGVVVIEREKIEPNEVQVGTIRLASEHTYVLRWLSANAEWENDDRPFRYQDVTRLEFGAGYEQSLLAVARSRESDA